MTPVQIWLVSEITSMTANKALKGIGLSKIECKDNAILDTES